MMDGIKDDASFSNLSNTNLFRRWTIIRMEGEQLLEDQLSTDEDTRSEKQTLQEKAHESCHVPLGTVIPSQSPLSRSIDWSIPAFHNRGFHLHNAGRPGNQGIYVSEYPVPEHRLAPIGHDIPLCQGGAQARKPRSEVQMVGDDTQRSHFWETISSNDHGNQSSRRLRGSQVNAAINPTRAFSDSHQGLIYAYPPYGRQASQARAFLNPEFASRYGGESPEANALIYPTYALPHGLHGPRTLHDSHASHALHPAHASYALHASHAPHASHDLHPAHASHASQDNTSVNPRDTFYYGSHGSPSNTSTIPVSHISQFGPPVNPEVRFQYGSHGSEANTFINPTYPFQYCPHASQVHAPMNPTYTFPYGLHVSQPNTPINPTHTFPYGRQVSEAGMPTNPTHTSPYGRLASEAVVPTNPTHAGRQASEGVVPTDPSHAFSYGSHGSQASRPINPTHAIPYVRQGSDANVSMNPVHQSPHNHQDSDVNVSMNPEHQSPQNRQGSDANLSITPEHQSPHNRQGLRTNVSVSRAYPLPYGRQDLEVNPSMNPAYPLPYGRQDLEANATINPAYPLSYSRQVSGTNASMYPPPIPPNHNPEHKDGQKSRKRKLCSKCDKPWHGSGPCPDESADQPRILAKSVKTRPDPSSIPSRLLTFRCGICGDTSHSRTVCPKDPARKKVPARDGQKVEKCENCGRYGHKAERCGNRYLEFWERAAAKARRERSLAAATQEPTAQSAPEPKEGGDAVEEGN